MNVHIKKIVFKTYSILNRVCSLTCHQRDDRSFFIKGNKLPLCSRCTGIVIGYLISIIFNLFVVNISLWISLVMVIPLVIDAGIQRQFYILSTNRRRLLTGLSCGFGLFGVNIYIVKLIVHIIININ